MLWLGRARTLEYMDELHHCSNKQMCLTGERRNNETGLFYVSRLTSPCRRRIEYSHDQDSLVLPLMVSNDHLAEIDTGRSTTLLSEAEKRMKWNPISSEIPSPCCHFLSPAHMNKEDTLSRLLALHSQTKSPNNVMKITFTDAEKIKHRGQ